MAIMIYQTDDGRVPGTEYLPCGTIIPKVGMALKLEGGKLAAAGGADLPAYLSMTERTAACEDGEEIPVIRISADIIFETGTPEGFTAVPGDKVQLTADGMGVSAVAGGAAEIVYTDEKITRFRLSGSSAAGE